MSHIYAAGDITGRLMLVPQAVQDGFHAATNAVHDGQLTLTPPVSPIGSFTDPEYAQAGLNKAKAQQDHDIVVAITPFSIATRPSSTAARPASANSSSTAPPTASSAAMSSVSAPSNWLRLQPSRSQPE